jgi:hypothetical protein
VGVLVLVVVVSWHLGAFSQHPVAGVQGLPHTPHTPPAGQGHLPIPLLAPPPPSAPPGADLLVVPAK